MVRSTTTSLSTFALSDRSSVSGGDSFDLILAADVVWLDELVEPLVRTLERLTAGWPSCGGRDGREQQRPQARPAAPSAASSAATAHASGSAHNCHGAVVASPPRVSPRLQRPRVGQRVLLAYQWRSQRTGDALLEELEKAFRVREIQPEVRRRHRNGGSLEFWFCGPGGEKSYHMFVPMPCLQGARFCRLRRVLKILKISFSLKGAFTPFGGAQ